MLCVVCVVDGLLRVWIFSVVAFGVLLFVWCASIGSCQLGMIQAVWLYSQTACVIPRSALDQVLQDPCSGCSSSRCIISMMMHRDDDAS